MVAMQYLILRENALHIKSNADDYQQMGFSVNISINAVDSEAA